MKKLILIVLLILGINSIGFSQTETCFSIGFEHGNFWENSLSEDKSVKGYIMSPGIGLSVYKFWDNKNIGLFLHDIFAFPSKMTAEVNNVKTDVDLSTSDFMIQIGILIGPGFRYNINNKLKLNFGIGINLMNSYAKSTISSYLFNNIIFENVSHSVMSINIGIGGDIGIKYDITDTFYLSIGNIVTFDFINWTSVGTSFSSTSGWAKIGNYSMIGIRPYICIGFNIFSSN